MSGGWIKLHRSILDNPIFNDLQLYRLWSLCLLKATHKEREVLVGKQIVHLQPGQFITGRTAIRELYNKGLKESDQVHGDKTVYRWLMTLEMTRYVTLCKTSKYTVVTVTNWNQYQQNDQVRDQVNDRLRDHKQEVKNIRNINSPAQAEQAAAPNESDQIPYKEIIAYLNEKAGKAFKHTAAANRKLIKARFNEGYAVDDFKHVVDTKVQQWLNDNEMNKYLRPATLFQSSKFDGYLNERPRKQEQTYKPKAIHEDELEDWEKRLLQ